MPKVLIVTTDLYSEIGGGQQVYRLLIENNPTIDFFYFTSDRKKECNLPTNAHSIPLCRRPVLNSKYRYIGYAKFQKTKQNHDFNSNEIRAAELAEQYAKSASGHHFDLIDLPEFELVGGFLREALERNAVDFRILASFIHGSLSRTLEFECEVSQEALSEIVELEKSQRNSADLFLALDTWYPTQLGIPIEKLFLLNPWQFIKSEYGKDKSAYQLEDPRLIFFARWERRKGPDLVPLIATYINTPKLDLQFFGDMGASARMYRQICTSASYRNLTAQFSRSTDSQEVYNQIGLSDILVIPSRFDSFNLIALEAIAQGKRVALSNKCGAFYFLRKNYPDIKFVPFNPDNLIETAKSIEGSLYLSEDWVTFSNHNIKSFLQIRAQVDKSQYTRIVEEILNTTTAKIKTKYHGVVFTELSFKRTIVNISRKLFQSRFLSKYKSKLQNVKAINKHPLIIRWKLTFTALFWYLSKEPLSIIPLRNIKEKIVFLKPQLFLALSNAQTLPQLTRMIYAIRALRFAGYETGSIEVRRLLSDLGNSGLTEEARCLELITNDLTGDLVFEYLEARRVRLLAHPLFQFNSRLVAESAKSSISPKISVIVSCYNGSSKIDNFLKRLTACPELHTGVAEIVFIDANSLTPDSEIASSIANKLGISLKAYRIDRKITIQDAWNFGITQARGNYLSFLGIDETIYPDALSTLAAILESDDSVDWVMADSIVTEVDSNGDYLRDVMKYSRRGANRASPFLETCYVSYVAGMYRKDIHERYGYYDPSFKGAGDTEFKSRVLPSLNVSFLDCVLGEFLNYPEERKTASQAIELEDIRAWYIFRTMGGIRYQASLAEDDFLELLGANALSYRKSYCEHLSTDIELASLVYRVIMSSDYEPEPGLLGDLENANKQLGSLRRFLGFEARGSNRLTLHQKTMLFRWFDVDQRISARRGAFRMRLDNMFEQHFWLWH